MTYLNPNKLDIQAQKQLRESQTQVYKILKESFDLNFKSELLIRKNYKKTPIKPNANAEPETVASPEAADQEALPVGTKNPGQNFKS